MRSIVVLALLFHLVLSGVPRALAGRPVDLTLVAFNIHLGGVGPNGNSDAAGYFLTHILAMLKPGPTPEKMFRTLNRTADLIRDLDPDVVVINEFSPWGLLSPFSKSVASSDPCKNSVSYLLGRLNRPAPVWKAHFTRYAQNWAGLFGNLVLYRVGRAITGEAVFHESYFKTKGTLPWSERIIFAPLDRHYVVAVLPVGELKVLVAGTHLEDHQDAKNVVVRRKAAQQMISELVDRRQALGNPPLLVLGDLNAIPPALYQGGADPTAIQRFANDRPGPADAAPIQKNTIQLFEEELVNAYVAKHGQLDAGAWTSPVTNPKIPLDYVLFTPDSDAARVEVLRAFVPQRTASADTISDHLPVVATVRLTPRTPR